MARKTVKVSVLEPFMFDGARVAPAKQGAKPKVVSVDTATAKSLARRGKVSLATGAQSIKAEREGEGGE